MTGDFIQNLENNQKSNESEKSHIKSEENIHEKAAGSKSGLFGQGGLFGMYVDKKETIFKEKGKDVLRHTYSPQTLPHRIPQIQAIAAILAPAIHNETPSNILIYGKTGTGKTTSVKYVGKELESTCRNVGKPCKVIYLNCEQIDTQYRVLAQIAAKLEEIGAKPSDKARSGIPQTGWSTDQVYSELKNMLESAGGVNVIILDEIDKLVRKGDEIIYNLTRFNTELRNAKISLIGISNDLTFRSLLDPRVISSLSEEELVFPPYNAPQLCDILRQRAEIAFCADVLEDGVINLCAALAAQEHGDARRALDLLRISGELADRENCSKVTESHVKQAQQKIDTDSIATCVKTLPVQTMAVLYSMILLADNKQFFTTGDVIEVYRDVAGALDLDVLTSRRQTDLISDLTMLGIINSRVVSRGRYGRTKEMWFGTGTDGIRKVIMNNDRFNQERLRAISSSQYKNLLR